MIRSDDRTDNSSNNTTRASQGVAQARVLANRSCSRQLGKHSHLRRLHDPVIKRDLVLFRSGFKKTSINMKIVLKSAHT